MNLALLQQYGSNAWRIHNFLLEQTAKNLEKAVEDLKQLTVEVNRERGQTRSTVGEASANRPPHTTYKYPNSRHAAGDKIDFASTARRVCVLPISTYTVA